MQDTFKLAMRRLAATVNVITCEYEGRPFGITATAVTSLSVEPQSLLVCVNKSSSICEIIEKRGALCVNILASHHVSVSQAFGGHAKGVERFNVGDWGHTDERIPYLADAQANIFCTVDSLMSYGTHNIFVGRVTDVLLSGDVQPLVYGDGRYLEVA